MPRIYGSSDSSGVTAGSVDLNELAASARPSSGSGGLVSGGVVQSFHRNTGLSNLAVVTSGRLQLVHLGVLPSGVGIDWLIFVSGSTALVTGTNQWACLVDKSLNVLAKTDDRTSTAWAASKAKKFSFAATYTPGSNIEVYAGLVVAATTTPSLRGINVAGVWINGMTPYAAASSTTGLTDPASLGATAGALTDDSSAPYATAGAGAGPPETV